MKSWPAGLITLLGTRSFVFCDLYTVTLADGTVLRYTTGQVDVLYAGNTWSAKWLFVDQPTSKAQAHWKVGLDVDTWVASMMPAATDPVTGAPYPATIYGQPWLAAVAAGALQGATVQIDRAYWAAWPAPGPVAFTPTYVGDRVFLGRVASIDVRRQEAIITLNSHLELLTTLVPRNLFQAPCRHTLFDAGCTLSQAAWAVAGNAVTLVNPSVPSAFNFSIAGPFPASVPLALGQILWTTGANAGFRRSVRSGQSIPTPGQGVLFLISPMPFPIQVGDQFTLYPGCDKQFSTCGLFANQVNFGTTGATVPVPETAV